MDGERRIPVIQSAVIPFRLSARTVEVLLITNDRGSRWLVPKGNVPKELTPQASAEREAREEAGVIGLVDPVPVGTFAHRKARLPLLVTVFPMSVSITLPVWPEMDRRRRRWVAIDEAAEGVSIEGLSGCIQALNLRLRWWRAA